MESNRERKIDMNELAIHLYVVARGRLRAEIGADLAVNRNTPVSDQFIALSPRTYAGGSEKTIQAHVEALKS